MTDLVTWLRAQYDDDERVAREAAPGPWEYQDVDSVGGGRICDPTVAVATLHYDTPGEVDPRIRRSIPYAEADGTGTHITRWDPARVLAEVAAKRQIIALHYETELESEPDHDPVGAGCAECGHFDWPCETLRLLAQPYASHPDFDPAWVVDR